MLRRELQTLREAVATRQVVGQATGLVAAQLNVNTDQAWQVLRQLFSLSNIKMRDVARLLIAAHNGSLTPEDRPYAAALGRTLPAAASRVTNSRPTTSADHARS